MFVSASKIKQNILLKGRTISFETVKKLFGNLVLIPTLYKEALYKTIDSTLLGLHNLWLFMLKDV